MRDDPSTTDQHPTIIDFNADAERRELVKAMVEAIRQMNAEAAERNLMKAFRAAA